jgi:CheY-like chemotaxis protein
MTGPARHVFDGEVELGARMASCFPQDGWMNAPRLVVMVVAGDPRDAAFVRRVLEDSGDKVLTAGDVPEALSKLAHTHVDVALVSLSMPRGDGLALVHHMRALYPSLDVVAMSKPDEMEEAGSAMALGVLTTIVAPLTGDEVRVAVDRARERRALIAERARFSASLSSSARRTDVVARAANFVTEVDPLSVARRVLEVCGGEVDSRARGFYVSEQSQGRLVRLAADGDAALLPDRLSDDSFDAAPTATVQQRQDELHLPLLHQGSSVGRVIFKLHPGKSLDDGTGELLQLVSYMAGAAFVAARRTDAIVRGGIRDVETSAYTFAYFGDLAAREIERAARHHRPFALLTLHFAAGSSEAGPGRGMGSLAELLSSHELSNLRKSTTQAVLSAVRESDVGWRASTTTSSTCSCPRPAASARSPAAAASWSGCVRVPLEQTTLSTQAKQRLEIVFSDASVGVSVFPVDGRDLGELLKLSRKRSERTRHSDWQKLALSGRTFWESVEQLLPAEGSEPPGGSGLGACSTLSAEAVSRIALGLIKDAQREHILGTLYLAGDAELSAQAARLVAASQDQSLRTWLLGPAHSVRDPAAEIRLPLTDSRLKTTSMILWMTERGGYCLLGRKLPSGELLAYHSCDLDLVEGLVNALQSTYHLQPELR